MGDWSAARTAGVCVGLLLVEWHAELIEKREGGKPYTVGRALQRVRVLESAGFLHYSSEVVCGVCSGQVELAFVNASWLAGLIRSAEREGASVD
jgi:hypothetical protein